MNSCMKLRCTKLLVTLVVGLGLSTALQGAIVNYDYDFTGYSVSEGSLEATFGTKIAELDAASYGFDFSGGDWEHGLRNLNIISQVFVATQSVTIGTGENGTQIELLPGDYTFAYTLDYSNLLGFYANSAVSELQIARNVTLGGTSNPGQMVAFEHILAGGYNTDSGFGGGTGTPPLTSYPDGFDGVLYDLAPTFAAKAEYDWGAAVVLPETKAMVFMFARDVSVWQVGWGSEDGEGKDLLAERQAIGDTSEGGSVIGGGSTVPGNIPMLVPVIPEPASMLTFLLIGNIFILTRRRKKNENTTHGR
jgi:hypothetical protein